jgi:hypothetical protein
MIVNDKTNEEDEGIVAYFALLPRHMPAESERN